MGGLADLIFVALIVLSIIFGFRKGIIRTVFGLVGGIVAAVIAFANYQAFSDWLVAFFGASGPSWLQSPIWRKPVSLLILFLLLDILIHFIGVLLDHFCRFPVLKQLNALLGAVFGLLRGVILVLVICASLRFAVPLNPSAESAEPVQKIASSYIYRAVYDHNPIYILFSPYFENKADLL